MTFPKALLGASIALAIPAAAAAHHGWGWTQEEESRLSGTVQSISHVIYRNALHSMDPNQSTESRIVEVTIRMDEVGALEHLVFLQVDVVIDL